MKYLFKLSLIPLAALMVTACSGPAAIQSSTETDDMYYASTDKTVFASKPVSVAEEQAVENNTNSNAAVNSDEVANPEYSARSNNNNNNNNNNEGSTYSDYDYYSEDYTYASRIRRFNSPYRGMSYYDFAYTDPYWYGSSFYAYDPFYSPGFYRPGFYTGLSLNLGWGNPFYSPFYGYGSGFYNPYGGYYSGYRNGFYNGFYNGYYASGANYDRYPGNNNRSRTYGPRGERSVVPVNGNTAGGGRISGNPGGRPARTNNLGGGAVVPGGNIGGVKSPTNTDAVQPQTRPGRGGRNTVVATPDDNLGTSQPARTATDNNVYQPSSRPTRRSVGTITTNEPTPTPPSFPADVQRTRPSRSQRIVETQPNNSESPRFETPRRQQRSPEIYRPEPAPQRNDSWSQPSQPSRSTSSPSNSGGSNSGGGRPRSRN